MRAMRRSRVCSSHGHLEIAVLAVAAVATVAWPRSVAAYECSEVYFRRLEVGFSQPSDAWMRPGRPLTLRFAGGDCKYNVEARLTAELVVHARTPKGPFVPLPGVRMRRDRAVIRLDQPGTHFVRVGTGGATYVPAHLVLLVQGPNEPRVRIHLPARGAHRALALVYVPDGLRSQADRVAVAPPPHVVARARQMGRDPETLGGEARRWILPVLALPLRRRETVRVVALPRGHYEVYGLEVTTSLIDIRGRFVRNKLGARLGELDVDESTRSLALPPR
jgi:hypothetical protein